MSDHDDQLSFDDVKNEPEPEGSDDYWPVPLDDVIQAWKSSTEHLRATGRRIEALAEELNKALTSHDARMLERTVTAFREIAECTRENDFMSLCLETVELHHRGTGVLDPDRSDTPQKSSFVRVIPQWEVTRAAEDRELQSRHIEAYETHLRQTFAHFHETWTALVDGALICDFVMIEGEFPKLADLAGEAQKARKMWMEAMRPWLNHQ
ncbi:hypothetical protein [Streptomyces sp. M92]|uniref:hypothetical protein n=1 Tax=Streptomyces sp. M92 TaxID=2944250 RepID=UPI00234B380A|nr:hypothetical protein [Streptomyces sp. M92]WCN07381.1 hypothetical protein M6G08_35670 [Streptomyces sp. M92]